jgi:hypothetical protein
MPNPGPLDLAQLHKIPPLRVKARSTSWYIACTWDRVYFAPGSAEISLETAACLEQIARRLSEVTPTYVYASADHQEAQTVSARTELMRRRTANVAEFLGRYRVWVEAGNVGVSEDLYMLRPLWMSVADYNQELRTAIIPEDYP